MLHNALGGRLALLTVVAALLLPAAAALATEPGSYDQALLRAAAENKPVVIDFYTDW